MRQLTHIYRNGQWIQVGEVNQHDLNQKIDKGSLGKINGISIEDGNDVNLDLCPYIIVEELPEDFDEIEKNKIYILISKTNVHFPEGIFDDGNYDEVGFTEDYIAGFFDRGNFDSIFFQQGEEQESGQEIIPDVSPGDIEDPSQYQSSWRFGVNSTFPIIFSDVENELFGALPVVEHASDGHYIFHVSNEKQKIGYWQKLNDNTFEVKLNEYLSLVNAERLYQPKGNYVTTQQAQEQYLTIETAHHTYQQKGNYLTISAAQTIYQEKGDYITNIQASSRFLSIEDAAQQYQTKGDYTSAYYIMADIYEDSNKLNLYTKNNIHLSHVYLNAATEEHAGLMSAQDKQYIKELESRIEYLTEKLAKVISKDNPAVFDGFVFNEGCYQEEKINPEDYDAIGTMIVYGTDGNTAQIKQVYTYAYNSDSPKTSIIISSEDDMNAALRELRLSINPENLIDQNDYIFINDMNSAKNVSLQDIKDNISPNFKVDNNQIFYKNEFGGWTPLITVDEINSLNVLQSISFEIDEDMNLSCTSNTDVSISAELDNNGYFYITI